MKIYKLKGKIIANIKLQYTDIFDNNKTKELSFSKELIKEEFNENSLFTTILDGKSMQPLIKDRSVLVVDLSKKGLFDNEIYLLQHASKMWVKKYDMNNKSFISVNPDFSHLVYKEDEAYVIGKILLSFPS